MKETKKAGIYNIRYCPSGVYYVGQSTNASNRISEHKNELRRGSHRNSGLQQLWSGSHEKDFIFIVVETPPVGLSPLGLQRWLVKAERNHINAARKAGLSLNINDAEIVKTKAAWEEHVIIKTQEAKEEERRSKERDKSIRAERKEINNELKLFTERAKSLISGKNKLNVQLSGIKKELNQERSLKSLLFGASKNIDFVNLKIIKSNIEKRIQEIESHLSHIPLKRASLFNKKSQLLTRKEALNRLRKQLPIPLVIDDSFRPRIGKIEE